MKSKRVTTLPNVTSIGFAAVLLKIVTLHLLSPSIQQWGKEPESHRKSVRKMRCLSCRTPLFIEIDRCRAKVRVQSHMWNYFEAFSESISFSYKSLIYSLSRKLARYLLK